MKSFAISTVLSVLLTICLHSIPAQAQLTRTWVSGVGNDGNPCTRTQPCQTFAGAIVKTAAAGEISCLDPGDFGIVTIAKSITIDCTATQGSILTTGGSFGVLIDTAGVNVILRGLSINGAITGFGGVAFGAGSSLTLENVAIMNHNAAGRAMGVWFSPSSTNAVLTVNNSLILSNGLAPTTGGGIIVQPFGGGTNALVTIVNSKIERNGGSGVLVDSTVGGVIMTVRDSSISNNTNGGVRAVAGNPIAVMLDRTTINSNSQSGVLSSGGNALVRINNSVVHANATGLTFGGGGMLLTAGNNTVEGNGNNGSFSGSYLQK